MTAPWPTLLQLATGALPVLAAYLLGRYALRQRIDQIEADAWDDGYTACLNDLDPHGMDEVTSQLTAAVEQAAPSDEPWWN